MKLVEILALAVQKKASDAHITPNMRLSCKINGAITPVSELILSPADTLELIKEAYAINGARDFSRAETEGDDDFAITVAGTGRFRCNVMRQMNGYAMVIRVLPLKIPAPEDFSIPDIIIELARLRRGMVLITGAVGSGKSTTLACMIDRINSDQPGHIITIEDPVEYVHTPKLGMVTQREVERDTLSYASALRAALRQAPDVILVGEMRDFETIQTALTAAETGQLLLSTLHTVGAVNTVDRIIDVFPPNQQAQVRVQLSMVLKAVISQQLIPSTDGGRVAAFEIMIANSAVQNLIREGKTHQLDSIIFSNSASGMRTMDGDIERLYREGRITKGAALTYAADPDQLRRKI